MRVRGRPIRSMRPSSRGVMSRGTGRVSMLPGIGMRAVSAMERAYKRKCPANCYRSCAQPPIGAASIAVAAPASAQVLEKPPPLAPRALTVMLVADRMAATTAASIRLSAAQASPPPPVRVEALAGDIQHDGAARRKAAREAEMDLVAKPRARPGANRGEGFVIALQAAGFGLGDGIAARACTAGGRIAERAPALVNAQAVTRDGGRWHERMTGTRRRRARQAGKGRMAAPVSRRGAAKSMVRL